MTLEKNNETSAAREQILNKKVYTAIMSNTLTNPFAPKWLEYNNERCLLHSPCWDVITETGLEVCQSFKGVCEEKT
jgi:hypothetical protein